MTTTYRVARTWPSEETIYQGGDFDAAMAAYEEAHGDAIILDANTNEQACLKDALSAMGCGCEHCCPDEEG